MIPDPLDRTRTLIMPPFLTEEQFRNPAYTSFTDLGVTCALFVPALAVGGIWLPEERVWILQTPCRTVEEHIDHVRRWLAATDQLSAAMRFCEAAENLTGAHVH